jgi:hypothetical protein
VKPKPVLIMLSMGSFALAGAVFCFAQQAPSKTTPTLLVDTDRECELTIDGKERGTITPSSPVTFPIANGEHIVKAYIKENPDIQWRKVVDINANKQFAVAIELREAAQPKQPASASQDKPDSGEKAATVTIQQAPASATPTTGKYWGTATAPDYKREYGGSDFAACPKSGCVLSGEGRFYHSNYAEFTLNLIGKSGDYIQATLDISGSNLEDWETSGDANSRSENKTETQFRMLLRPSTTDPKTLELQTCRRSSKSSYVRNYLKGSSPPDTGDYGDLGPDCATDFGNMPLKLKFEDETKVSFSISPWIGSWPYLFNDAVLTKTF